MTAFQIFQPGTGKLEDGIVSFGDLIGQTVAADVAIAGIAGADSERSVLLTREGLQLIPDTGRGWFDQSIWQQFTPAGIAAICCAASGYALAVKFSHPRDMAGLLTGISTFLERQANGLDWRELVPPGRLRMLERCEFRDVQAALGASALMAVPVLLAAHRLAAEGRYFDIAVNAVSLGFDSRAAYRAALESSREALNAPPECWGNGDRLHPVIQFTAAAFQGANVGELLEIVPAPGGDDGR